MQSHKNTIEGFLFHLSVDKIHVTHESKVLHRVQSTHCLRLVPPKDAQATGNAGGSLEGE